MDYLATIGIEIHAELKTKSKMFSAARVTYDEEPNTNVSAIDLAFPGVLPTINKQAVVLGLKVCKALDMEIDSLLRFDRKNYFYSDLPKGYQITQQCHPLGKNGKIVLEDGREIRVNRLHLEEDTGKQIHTGDDTLIDFNRAGLPLIEVVSEPEIHSAKDAAEYVEALRQILVYLDVCDGVMAEGSMRCDINVSISKDKDTFGTKVEIKNLNSISNIQKAIEYELDRQKEVLSSGGAIYQETRRFDEASQTTVSVRKKEGAANYRYHRDPNIVPIQLDQGFLDQVESQMLELPREKLERFKKELEPSDAKILVANKELADFYDSVREISKHGQAIANLINTDLVPMGLKGFNPKEIGSLVDKLQDKTLSSKQGKQLVKLLNNSEKTLDQLIKENNMVQISDDSVIIDYIEKILEDNPQVIEDYKKGKDRSVKFVMGQVMKLSRGQANPVKANELTVKILSEK